MKTFKTLEELVEQVKENKPTQINLYCEIKRRNSKMIKEQEQEIEGYIFKKGCEKYTAAVHHIANITWFLNRHYLFTKDSFTCNRLKEAGVLDIWFEPVYKKKKVKTTFGGKEVIITKGIVTCEGIKFKISDIITLHTKLTKLTSISTYDNQGVIVEIIADTIKIGCTVGTNEELANIIELHKSLTT